ncbi:MAG: SPFH domain-containing protein [Roseibium sp.]|uniref:SPFH domain-containing protein n=1 Tax=Roseibium sp. TaxID=1936156 RepID=UPI003296C431
MDPNTFAVGFILGIILLVILATTIVVTPQEHARIVETFMKFSSVRSAGLSFKLPWPIQTTSEPISLQVTQASMDVSVKSRDNTFLDIPIRVQYTVDPSSVRLAYYKLSNPQPQIESFVVNQVISSASGKDFDELFASTNAMEVEVKAALAERMAEFGYVIENMLIDDPKPSLEVRQSFDKVLASKRLLEAAENEGEAQRVISVAGARAEAEALEIRGKALVQFRETIVEGNAKAIQEFIRDTDLGSHDALEFIMNINEMEALTRVGETGGRVVYISASAKDSGADVTAGLVNGLPSPSEPTRKPRRGVAKAKPKATPAPKDPTPAE